MSFVRKRTPSVTSGNRQVGVNPVVKKKSLTKPIWDATNSDLSQLKPTNEELERRKQSFQSKNAETVKNEKQRQAMLKAKREQPKSDSRSQLAMLKEILYDDEQLKKLMTKSDVTLKTVQDFFNDDEQAMQNTQIQGNKKQVKINMTLAPNVTDLNESNLPHNPRNKNPKKQSNLIQKAQVNNINDCSDEEENSDAESDILDMKLKLAKRNEDIDTYRQLLELKQDIINKKLNSPSLKKKPLKKPLELNDLDECIKMLTSKGINTPQSRPPNTNNSNDTEKINRLKNLIKNYASSINLESEEPSSDQHNTSSTPQLSARPSSLSNLNDEFKRALTDLENKLYDFEKETGHKKASDCSIFKSLVDGSSSMSNSSYTLSLIKIVSTMLDYQKETINELNHEKLKNQESNKQLDIHRKLIDGLTNEILSVKEQNEKISHCYINQANQQAKVEAEMEQIKVMLRTSSIFSQGNYPPLIQMQPNPPPIIDSQPKTMSAFYPAQHPDINSIVKPLPQPFNDKQQQLRPMSCVTSINEYNRQNNDKNPLDEALNEVKTDKFVERLNAMLYHNNQLEGQITSASCHNLAVNNSRNMNNFQQQSVIRSTSALGHSNQFRPNDFNNSSEIMNSEQSGISLANSKYSDYNTRLKIQELGAKNIQAQQILKQMQAEQLFANPSSHNLKAESSEKPKIQENLNKLKEEQQSLKDQINKLNKQRESAKVELEVLSQNGSVRSDRQSRSTFMKQLQEIEFDRLEINGDETPNMSPIPNENIFHEGIEAKSSGNRFTLPSNATTANSQHLNNKNRD